MSRFSYRPPHSVEAKAKIAKANFKFGLYLKDGYYYIRTPLHPNARPNGSYPLHRLIMEFHIGRYLLPTEHIHHINGDRLDNRISNMQVLSLSEHSTIHNKERMGRKYGPRNKGGKGCGK